MADGRFDDLLLGMARKHKNVEELSYSILSFFERRTDLFHIMETPTDRMGFKPGVAEDMLFKHFHHFQNRYMARAQPEVLKQVHGAADTDHSLPQGHPALENSTSASAAAVRPADQPAAGPELTSAGREMLARGASSSSSTAAPGAAAGYPSSAAAASSSSAAAATPAGAGRRLAESAAEGEPGAEPALEPAMPEATRKMMKHISTWNGAKNDKYYWSQSLQEVTLEVEVDECRARDIKVDVTATRLSVKCKGRVVLEGKLHEKVNIEETMWHLDDSKQIVLSMEKQRETWWKCVLEGDQEIDTSKVESTRSMEEYDGETQGAIRKIMFDQNQKVQGKPTSDQIRTADMMKDAWNAPGSPFRGSEFDPSMLNLSSPVSDEFFQDLDQKRIEDARRKRDEAVGVGAASSQ